MEAEKKYAILEGISGCVPENGAGEDEENLLQNFLPLRSYNKLADPKNFLITGGRGSGKTELFRILTSCGGLQHILSEKDRARYSRLKPNEFVTGFITTGTEAKYFPAANTCDELLVKAKPDNLTSFWGALLCSVILRQFIHEKEMEQLADQYFDERIKTKLTESSSEISVWWNVFDSQKEKWESFLDKADSLLEKKGRFFCVVYDELDRICSNYDELFKFIRSLLDFWYRHHQRFTNIKAKIFLRNDLYNAKALQFVDASKMRAYQFELSWDVNSLYRLLVKRLANAGVNVLEEYLCSVPGLLQPKIYGELGYLPGDSEAAIRELIAKMIGQYMGKNAKRGVSYFWVPNHIQDANGEVTPRAFLKCFAFAAEEMLQHKEEIEVLEAERVLSPVSLQGAVAKVSVDRVYELTREEYPWLQNLIARLKNKTMLMEKNEFLTYLSPEHWLAEERIKLPGKTGQEILAALMNLGIVMEIADGRINVPEIYLHGFGLKRKGGIKRPK